MAPLHRPLATIALARHGAPLVSLPPSRSQRESQMTTKRPQWVTKGSNQEGERGYKVLLAEKKGIIEVLDEKIRQMEKDVKRFGKIVRRISRGD